MYMCAFTHKELAAVFADERVWHKSLDINLESEELRYDVTLALKGSLEVILAQELFSEDL